MSHGVSKLYFLDFVVYIPGLVYKSENIIRFYIVNQVEFLESKTQYGNDPCGEGVVHVNLAVP